jgi:hypothetical protein
MGIALVVGVIAALIWGGITVMRMVTSARHRSNARELTASGDWRGAAASYKKAILERLDSSVALPGLVGELAELYQANSVEADLDTILESPRLLKEIWKSRVKGTEQHRLTAELHAQVARVLDDLP